MRSSVRQGEGSAFGGWCGGRRGLGGEWGVFWFWQGGLRGEGVVPMWQGIRETVFLGWASPGIGIPGRWSEETEGTGRGWCGVVW